jgi:hypothetical protein
MPSIKWLDQRGNLSGDRNLQHGRLFLFSRPVMRPFGSALQTLLRRVNVQRGVRVATEQFY